MKKRGSFTIVISLFLVMTMMILTPFGALCGYAEDGTEEVSVESQTPAVEVTEDGHIDGERLKQWVDAYLKADRWDEPQCAMSIGLWYSGTDETWFYNPDEWMYGVNWSKLPISMYFAEKLAKGELSKDTVITGITLEYALQTVLESSSGPSIYSMLTYLGGNSVSNCAELVPQYAGLPEDYYTDEFYQESYYTARIMHEVTKTLYRGGDERFPNVLEYMKKSQPWDMFNRDDYIRNNFSAAQAHAASWGDGAGDFIHCTGVLYTPTPIVLTIMMKNISDLDIMGGVAHHIAELAVAMDAKQQEIRLTAETAAPSSAETQNEASQGSVSVPEADSTAENPADDAIVPAAETAADGDVTEGETEEKTETEMSAPVPESASEEPASQSRRVWLIIISTLIVLAMIGISLARKIGKEQRR